MFKSLAVSLLLGEVSSRLSLNTYACTKADGCTINTDTEFVMDSNYCRGSDGKYDKQCGDSDYSQFGVSTTDKGNGLI